jgi:hypothetical protein
MLSELSTDTNPKTFRCSKGIMAMSKAIDSLGFKINKTLVALLEAQGLSIV